MRSCRIVSLATVALLVAAVAPSATARAESPPAASPTSPPLSIDSAVPSPPSFDSLVLLTQHVELRAIDSVQHTPFVIDSQAIAIVHDSLSVAELSRLEPRTSATARHARQRAHSSRLPNASNRLRPHRAQSFHPLTQ
jgi:hypothetical protein